MTSSTVETPADFGTRAEAWIAERLPRRASVHGARAWGEGSDSVALFHNLSPHEERAVVDRQRAWYCEKATQGFHAISWAPEFGGLGIGREYETAFAVAEVKFVTPLFGSKSMISLNPPVV